MAAARSQQSSMNTAPTRVAGEAALRLRLAQLLKNNKRDTVPTTLGLIQLKNFYQIRQWVGKSDAELLLAPLVRQVLAQLPADATLYRCANYEFMLLLQNAASLNARDIAETVCQQIRHTGAHSLPRQLQLNCAIGLVKLAPHVTSVQTLFANARLNLRHVYQPDTQRFNPFQLVPPAHDGTSQRIHQALEQHRIGLRFQPLLQFNAPCQHAYSITPCWAGLEDDTHQDTLRNSAINFGVGERLDRWLILQALASCRGRDGKPVRLYVPVTPDSLVSPTFSAWLNLLSEQYAEQMRKFTLQLREVDVLICQHHMTPLREALEDAGIQLQVVEFGGIQDPMRYLSLLPVTSVCLDVSLHGKLYDPNGIKSLIKSLHAENIQVMATGIVERAQMSRYWRLGIDWVQGSCIAHPSATREFQFAHNLTVPAVTSLHNAQRN